MNEEMLKSALLEIMEEAENLPASELEVIPGTRIQVKKGRVDEFKANARFYYEMKNNIRVNNDNYLREVYYELSDELARVEVEHALSKAYDLSGNKEELEQLENLNRSLLDIANRRKGFQANLDELNKKSLSDPKVWEEITNNQNALKTLDENTNIIENRIAEITTKVNNDTKKVLEEEMEYLKQNYLNMPRGTEFSILGEPFNATILKKDEEIYKSLWALSKIIDNVDIKGQVVAVDSVLCVNPQQVDVVKSHLANINLFKLVEPPKKEQVEEGPKKTNNDLIAKIRPEVERLRAKIEVEASPSDQIEFNNLTQILKYLNAANQSEFALTPVWDIAYVNGPDREAMIATLKRAEFLKGYNPDLRMIRENEQLIENLQKYLETLENKFNHYTGSYNIPVAQVGNTIILKEDEQEYRNVVAIIDILRNSKEDLIPINNAGNVSYKDRIKYENLMNETKYFTPNLMAKKTKEQNTPILVQIQKDIQENQPSNNQIDLIRRQMDILSNVDVSKETKEVNGAIINADKEEEYKKIVEELKSSKENIKPTQDSSQNASIELGPSELDNQTLNSEVSGLPAPYEVPGLPAAVVSQNLEESPNDTKEPLRKRAVKSIRKAKETTKEWWKKNGKRVAVIGLSAAAIAFAIYNLAPTVIYLTSHLAAANPALAGGIGAINNTIVNAFGLSLGQLNLTMAANQAGWVLLKSAANLGILGLGISGIVNSINQKTNDRLPDPNRRTVAKRILDLGGNILDKAKDLGQNLLNKASEFTENLAYATDSSNIELNKDIVNAKMTVNPEIQDANFKEIESNVQKRIEEEDRDIAENRIEERYNRIKNDNDAVEIVEPTVEPSNNQAPVSITIPTDAEIYANFSNKYAELERTDKYIDAIKAGDTAKAQEYQKLVFEDTGIDLSKYNMNNNEELIQARNDVANYMNNADTEKRSL